MHLRLAHSPDPDDAFMFYGLACGAVPSDEFTFEHILADIQTLNEAALDGKYEITAISIHAYPRVADRYALMSCGASMGDGYGPLVVAREPRRLSDLRGRTIAIPGMLTTAYLALQLALGPDSFEPRVVLFDQIPDAVAAGQVDAGLVIHEGQLTYARLGLHVVADLGSLWKNRTGLPLPLGGNVIRRDLVPPRGGQNSSFAQPAGRITRIIRESIRYGLEHRPEAVRYALQYGRGLDEALADRFVGMYVNKWTIDYGVKGRAAVQRLLADAAAAGLVPAIPAPDFV